MFCKLTGLVEMQVGAVIFDALFALLVETLHIHCGWALNVEMLNSFVLAKEKRKVINAILFALFFAYMYLEDVVFAVVGLLRLIGDRPRN